MIKFVSPIFAILLNILLVSCLKKDEKLTRESRTINKETFFGMASEKSEDKLEQFSNDFKIAFNLVSLKNANSETEIRIYYASVWRERFFKASINKDSIKIDLLNCKTDRRNDSLFMTIGTIISAKGINVNKMDKQIELLPQNKIWEYSNDPPILDGGDTYFIEVKRHNEIRRILIYYPFDLVQNDINAKHVSDFIKTITDRYNFRFNDEWNNIDSTAFRNNLN